MYHLKYDVTEMNDTIYITELETTTSQLANV